MSASRTTIFDVARVAGVGKSTAARVLRNAPHVSEKTREKVRQAADALGYRPDPALRLLLQRRQGKKSGEQTGLTLVFLSTARRHHYGLRTGFFRGAAHCAEKMGYRLERWFAEDYASDAALERVLWHRGVRGVLLDVVYNEERLLSLDWKKFAAVACGVGEMSYPLQTVDMNLSLSVRTCLDEVVRRGHRRIAVSVFYGGDNEQELLREGAFRYEKAHLPEDCVIETFSARIAQESPEKFVRWVRKFRPSVVVGNHRGFFDYLKNGGIFVPQQVSFVSLNVAIEQSSVSGTVYDSEKIGVAATELLELQIQGYHTGAERDKYQFLIPPVWRDGETLIPVPALRSRKNRPQKISGT